MSFQIVGVSGYARSGKDTVGKILFDHAGLKPIAFADAVYDAAIALNPAIFFIKHGKKPVRLNEVVDDLGWSEAKEIKEVRRTLQRIGTEVGRQVIDPDIWVKIAFRKASEAKKEGFPGVVFTDMRFRNEAHEVRFAGGRCWRIERPGVTPPTDDNGRVHISETDLAAWQFDHIFDNDGTVEDLAIKVKQVFEAE